MILRSQVKCVILFEQVVGTESPMTVICNLCYVARVQGVRVVLFEQMGAGMQNDKTDQFHADTAAS